MVYYRKLLHDKDLSPNEGIVYSTLLSHSLMTSEYFDAENGKLDIDTVKLFIQSNSEEGYGEVIEYRAYDNISRFAASVGMTRNSVKKILKSLKEKNYLNPPYISCPYDLLDDGYIQIPLGTGLKGQQLLFYARLLERSFNFKGTIDTMAYRLSELYDISIRNVYFLIHSLHEKGFVERLKDGRLKIKKLVLDKNKKESLDSLSNEQID